MSTPKDLVIIRAECYETGLGPDGCEAVLFCNDADQTQLYVYSVEDAMSWLSINIVSPNFEVVRIRKP